MKWILFIGLAAIVAALAAAGVFMLRRPPTPKPQKAMAWALAVRVGLSVTLFLVIVFAYLMGWIHPTGIPLKPQ